jgi:hypothetical protein
MKLGSLLLVLAAAAAAAATASLAVASPPQGKDKPATGHGAPSTGTSTKTKPPRTGDNCRPRVSVVLKGVLVDAPGAAGTFISVKVTSANHHGALVVKSAQPVQILVGPKTVVRRQGGKTLADLVSGDRVLVQARACKADLGQQSTADGVVPQLVATRIVAHPVKATSSAVGS